MAYLKTLLIGLFALLIIATAANAEVEFIGEPEQWNRFIPTLYKQDIRVSGENITVFVYCEKNQIAINPNTETLGKSAVDPNTVPYGKEVFDKICKITPEPKPENSKQKTIATILNQSHEKATLLPSGIYKYVDKNGVLHLSYLPGSESKKSYSAPTPEKLIKAENLRLKQVAKKMEQAIWPIAKEMGYGTRTEISRNLIQAKCYTEPNEQGRDSIICSLRFPTNYSMDYMTGDERREYHNIQALTKIIAVAFASNKIRESFFIKSSARFNGDYKFVSGFFYNKDWDLLKQIP